MQGSFADLNRDVQKRYGVRLKQLGSLGVSGMMHGYIPLDDGGRMLAPFRTWRNTNTAEAAEKLSETLAFNMPHRWSATHLYQVALDEEDHVEEIREITTLAGLVHQKLTGESVLGVVEASGMFPIDPASQTYDAARLDKYDRLLRDAGLTLRLQDLLPRVLVAGQPAGGLTEGGARLLDPSGMLQSGALMCPPEGDAGTGVVATNAVLPHTGNVSAGTSIFAMVVLEDNLKDVHPELDIVATPDGLPVAMVHSNNGTSELAQDAWAGSGRLARGYGVRGSA